jgi:hypothetical protein
LSGSSAIKMMPNTVAKMCKSNITASARGGANASHGAA